MKRLALFVILLIACVTHCAEAQKKPSALPAEQLNFDEPYNLIELLRLPTKTSITWKISPLQQQDVYRLFLGSRLDFLFEEEVKIWVKKWNGKYEEKYGRVKIVADIILADIILARYQNLRETGEEIVISEATRTPNMIVGTMKTTFTLRPQYSYLLMPKDKDFEIIWRQRKLIRREEKSSKNTAANLLAALTKRLKAK